VTRAIDLVGERFGRLVVQGRAEHASPGAYWKCNCDCGGTTIVRSSHLRGGATESCGCLQKERSSAAAVRHGGCGTPEHDTWRSMLSRCYNPNVERYPIYGGRGIRVCSGWRADFAAFLADMGKRPSQAHSIDRKDSDGNYSCGHCSECIASGWTANCRWATVAEQQRNRRNNRRVTIDGVTRCLREWSAIGGRRASVIGARLDAGWSPEEAVFGPPMRTRRKGSRPSQVKGAQDV